MAIWSDWTDVGVHGEWLWINTNPEEEFAGQIIKPTFSSANGSLLDYKFIIFMGWDSVLGEHTMYACSEMSEYILSQNHRSVYLGEGYEHRYISFNSSTDIFISPAYDGNNNITIDAYVIPTRIIGYRDFITDI